MKMLSVLISLLLYSQVIVSQNKTLPLNMPNCVLLDSNRIWQPVNEAWQTRCFIAKLDSVLLMGQGRVNILHIGGSHVQADMYTHVIRQCFDSLNAGLRPPRGFLFPYKIAKTNNPLNFSVSYGGEWSSARNAAKKFTPTQGLSGINVQTADTTASFNIKLNRDSLHRYYTTHINLFAYSRYNVISPIIIAEDSTQHHAYQVTRIDTSAISSVYSFNIPYSEQFSVCFDFSDSSIVRHDTITITGIYTDNDEPGIVYNSVGVNGASVPSYLGCNDFERDIKVVNPDLAIFGIGINDATASDFSDSLLVANYNTLIAEIRRAAPECALLFITNNDSYNRRQRKYFVNKNGLIARSAFYELGNEWNSGVWDLFQIMGGLESMKKWQQEGLASKDKVHFTFAGYDIVGRLFWQAFSDFYLNY